MKTLLCLCLLLCASCAGTKAQRETERYYSTHHFATAVPPVPPVAVKPDSVPVPYAAMPQKLGQVSPEKTFFQKINPFYKPESQKKTGPPTAQNATQMPRKCKGCQFVIQNGNGNSSTQASTDKKATSATGDAAKVAVAGKNSTQATDSAVAANSKGGALAAGPKASASGGAAPVEALSPLAVIADNATKWIPYVAVGAALLLVVALWRKKKQADSIIS